MNGEGLVGHLTGPTGHGTGDVGDWEGWLMIVCPGKHYWESMEDNTQNEGEDLHSHSLLDYFVVNNTTAKVLAEGFDAASDGGCKYPTRKFLAADPRVLQ